jgi:hypothetical protein
MKLLIIFTITIFASVSVAKNSNEILPPIPGLKPSEQPLADIDSK